MSDLDILLEELENKLQETKILEELNSWNHHGDRLKAEARAISFVINRIKELKNEKI